MNTINLDEPLDEFDFRFLDSGNGKSKDLYSTINDLEKDYDYNASLSTPITSQPFKYFEYLDNANSNPPRMANPRMRNSIGKQMTLASPLLECQECPFKDFGPIEVLETKHEVGQSQDKDDHSPHSEVKFVKKKKPYTRYKVSKSSTTSPTLRPSLKPSVTIASIDTFSNFQKMAISQQKTATCSVITTTAIPVAAPTHVGNPFYRPHKFKSTSSIPTLAAREHDCIDISQVYVMSNDQNKSDDAVASFSESIAKNNVDSYFRERLDREDSSFILDGY
ncbi:uncharacterized protein RJT20DRAFT_26732 [Scheffersomyces xylosifermentans]|uniref:uncharacterized protein n=1 Tax=Scheffersomyces xylosifermentans TaxID=1304137 RepID=UPI00315D19F8